MRALCLWAIKTLVAVAMLYGTARAQSTSQDLVPLQEPVATFGLIAAPAGTHGSYANASTCVDFERSLATPCWGPRWTLMVDAIFLHRSQPAPAVLLENTVNPSERWGAGGFDFGFRPGVDVTLARRLGHGNSIEARYFGIEQWSANEQVDTTPGDLLRLNTAVPFFFGAGTGIRTQYASDLHNFEINGLHELSDRCTLLAGFRYVEVDEELQATLVEPPVAFGFRSHTRNRLYGFQLGSRIQLWGADDGCGGNCSRDCGDCGRLTIDGIGKVGLFGNQPARQGVITCDCPRLPVDANGNGVIRSTTPVSPHAAFVGELGVTATYRLRNRVSLRAGYRMLWLDGLALASDQVAVTAFVPHSLAPRPAMDTSGDVFYHGAFVGLQCQW